jgi:hypothetical protein
MRVLCLHDSNHSGSALESQLEFLRDRLKEHHNIELVFVDSPFVFGNHHIKSNSIVTNYRSSSITSDIRCYEADNYNLSTPSTSPTQFQVQNKIEKSGNSNREEMQQLSSQDENMTGALLSATGTSSETHRNNLSTQRYTNNRSWFESFPSEIYTKNRDYSTNSSSGSSSSSEDSMEQSQKTVEYVGLDASLFHLGQIWNQNQLSKPYKGILAFGQGAALAGIIPLIQKRQMEALKKTKKNTKQHHHVDYYMPGLDFMILVSGYPLTPPPHKSKCRDVPSAWHELQHGFIDSSSIDTLHVIGMRNTVITPTQSMSLARRFTFPRIYQYDSGDHQPFPVLRSAAYYNVIGRFLVRQKKKDLSLKCPDILRLQRQLHNTEERAAQLLINTLATNPPKVLMAIISPNTVGGWLGRKERSSEDGGGAPCPTKSISKRTIERNEGHND